MQDYIVLLSICECIHKQESTVQYSPTQYIGRYVFILRRYWNVLQYSLTQSLKYRNCFVFWNAFIRRDTQYNIVPLGTWECLHTQECTVQYSPTQYLGRYVFTRRRYYNALQYIPTQCLKYIQFALQ